MVLNLSPIFSCDFPPVAPLVSGENDPILLANPAKERV
jgi:hypothetical protein